MSRMTEEELSACSHRLYKPLTYVLAFFHAVVQERRKYGKIGWNIRYDFNESDFRVSHRILRTYLDRNDNKSGDEVPWKTIIELIGEIIYGGRVIDSFDRRVLMTYLQEYLGDFLFDAHHPFHFYADGKVDYKIPAAAVTNLLEDYLKEIESLPLANSPEVFGLHPDAETGYLADASRDLLGNLLLMQPRRSGDSKGGQSREEYIASVAADIQRKLPPLFDVVVVRKSMSSPSLASATTTSPSPTQVVLLQELDRWNALVACMDSSLKDLQRALKGEIGMSVQLDELSQSIANGQLPAHWALQAPQTLKSLSAWMSHFERRHQQYVDWVKRGEPNVVWLSGLHIPEQYLTAIVQTACRKNGWPLDRATLFTEVTNVLDPAEILERPQSGGCYISGLYLEGAAWSTDRMCLERAPAGGRLLEELPIVRIVPIESNKMHSNVYKAPVYTTQQRRNAMGVGLVFESDLTSNEHNSHWILQGVCVVLNDSE